MYSCQIREKISVLLSGVFSLTIFMTVHLRLISCLLNSSQDITHSQLSTLLFSTFQRFSLSYQLLNCHIHFSFRFPCFIVYIFQILYEPFDLSPWCLWINLYYFYVICRSLICRVEVSAMTVAVEDAEYLLLLKMLWEI